MLELDNTMLREENLLLIKKDYLTCENSDENYDEGGQLEIDLEYSDYMSMINKEQDEPLDLSMKRTPEEYDHLKEIHKPNLQKLETRPNFSVLEENSKITTPNDTKGRVIIEKEVEKLLDPFVKSVHKKFCCTVCDIKFATKVKALTHVENKHVDCLQYKCPLCRASKVTRLAYESHLRRGHGAKVKDYSPLIKIMKKFVVKSEARSNQPDTQNDQPYDLEFVTFLRHILSMSQEVDRSSHTWHKAITCAEWIDEDQGIFRINNRQEFSTRWYKFKCLDHMSWDCFYSSVITEFINRNIFKQLSRDDLVFQVFCIKQLLK